MHNLVFLDTEATGVGEEDRVIQVAYNLKDEGTEWQVNEMFKPPVPIKKGAMAIHHVTEKMIADKPPFAGSSTQRHLVELDSKGYILVAHNAPYDLGMLEKEGVLFSRFIDTLKVAKHLDDGQFENHQLQYLRYHYDLEIELGMLSPHDALADIIVLEHVFWELAEELMKKEQINLEESLDMMLDISSKPLLLKNCKWPKHPNVPWAEVVKIDRDYMKWQLDNQMKKPEGERDVDMVYTLNYYLNK